MFVSSVDRFLFNRRDVLGAGVGLAAVAAGLGVTAARARSNGFDTALDFGGQFDPKRPEHNTLAFCKLMSDTRDGVETCGYFKGNVLAYIDGTQALVPLFGYEGFGMTRTFQVDDYAWQKLHSEVAYYTDLKTGEVMDTWHNPFLDETVRVVHVHNDVVNSNWAPTYSFGVGPEKVTFPFVFPWVVMGDNAVVDFGAFAIESGSGTITMNSAAALTTSGLHDGNSLLTWATSASPRWGSASIAISAMSGFVCDGVGGFVSAMLRRVSLRGPSTS